MSKWQVSTHFLPSSIPDFIAESCRWFISPANDRFPTFAHKSCLSGHDAIADVPYAVHLLYMKLATTMKTAFLIVAGAASLLVGIVQFQQRLRTFEGTWLWQFEGSDFFERRLRGRECELYLDEPSWLNYDPTKIYPSYTYKRKWPSSGTYDSRSFGQFRIEAFEVKFRGRKRFSLFGTGHFGLWNSEYDVEEMLSSKPISNLHCSVR